MTDKPINIQVAPIPKNKIEEKPKIKSMYKELGTTKDGYMSYINIFDNSKGFNYVPTARIQKDSIYSDVQGIAHFLYDYDATTDTYAQQSESLNRVGNKKNSLEAVKDYRNVKGSTVTNPYFTVIEKNDDNKTVNIKYKRASEITSKDKLADSLRQYKFTDLDWKGTTSAKSQGFNNTVAALPTTSGNPSQFIYAKGLGKDAYGKFGGGSVIFLINGKDVAIDFAGSINQIKSQGEALIKEFNIKPEELVIAYHDLGSYSAKPNDKDGKIDSKRYSKFNTNLETGAGLAIPKNINNGD